MIEYKETIAIANDHAGYKLKTAIADYLRGKSYDIIDVGAYSDAMVDYPTYARLACETVLQGKASRAILICGTGLGMSIAANKIKGIRCAAVSDAYSAQMATQHNNCNALAFGARVIDEERAKRIADAFLLATFDPKHQPRLDMLAKIESEQGSRS